MTSSAKEDPTDLDLSAAQMQAMGHAELGDFSNIEDLLDARKRAGEGFGT